VEVLFCVRAAGRPSLSMNAGAFRSELVIRRYGQHHRRPTGEKNDGNERGSGKRFDPAQWYLSRERSVETANTTLDVAIEHVRAYVPDFLREIDLSRIRTLLPDENTALIAFCITDQGSESFVMQRDCAIRTIETPAFTRSELRRLFAVWDTDGAAIGGWLGAYMHQLAENTPVTIVRWQETITNVLEHLGKHLLNPVLSALPPPLNELSFYRMLNSSLFHSTLLPWQTEPRTESVTVIR
jgi:hypothetical protein